MQEVVFLIVLLIIIWIKGCCIKKVFSGMLCNKCSNCACKSCSSCTKKITCGGCKPLTSCTLSKECQCKHEGLKNGRTETVKKIVELSDFPTEAYSPIYRPTTYGMRY